MYFDFSIISKVRRVDLKRYTTSSRFLTIVAQVEQKNHMFFFFFLLYIRWSSVHSSPSCLMCVQFFTPSFPRPTLTSMAQWDVSRDILTILSALILLICVSHSLLIFNDHSFISSLLQVLRIVVFIYLVSSNRVPTQYVIMHLIVVLQILVSVSILIFLLHHIVSFKPLLPPFFLLNVAISRNFYTEVSHFLSDNFSLNLEFTSNRSFWSCRTFDFDCRYFRRLRSTALSA